jgi:glutamine cyclotransferase
MKRILLPPLLLLAACGNEDPNPPETTASANTVTVPTINYTVVKAHPHDTSLFTEGLLVHDGKLFESTGSPAGARGPKSLVGVIDLSTGKMDKKVELDAEMYFGEGIAFLNGKLYQLTYKTQIGFIYDARTFKQTGTFHYANAEGWSLTTDGRNLIMSDGSPQLTWLSADSLKPIKRLTVTEDGAPLHNLNELEYIKGYIYANIWMTNTIVRIDPTTGKVLGKLNLGSLEIEAKARQPNVDVLNGIAYDAATDKIYVTGKLWPNIYEISFPH